ncbi:MAG TPA: hypothetical protein VM925_05960 [Labilithrix sp.]|nr:hypothetical protein [Labilithrix sp.]
MFWKTLRCVTSFGALALATACSLPGFQTESGEGGTNDATGANGDRGTAGEDRTGPNGMPAGGFVVSGHIPLDLSSKTKTLDGVGGDSAPKQITHVVAVTPSSQNTARVVSKVAANGDFSLDLDPARLWVLVFVDATRTGSDMIVGVFRARGLDTMAPMKKGEANLGEIVTEGGGATSSTPYEALLSAMGIDPESALYLSSIDDMCLRVVNPDVDGNGVIDALEEHKDFRLDFHVQFAMRTDHNVSVNDLVGEFLPDTVTMNYGGTGIYASFPEKAVAAGWQSSTSASFDETIHYAPMGGSGPPGAPRTAAGGEVVPSSDLLVSGYGNYGSLGLMAIPGFDMPQGSYRFGVGPSTLTFTNVKTRTDSQLAAAESFIMPFVRFTKTSPSCETGCTLSGIDYVWRKRTEGGWVEATAGEIAVVAGEQGGFLSIRIANDTAKNIGFVIPATSVSGTIAWTALTTPDEAAKAAGLAATTSELCHIGLSYDDKLGMRYFGGIQDAPGTCGAN